MGERRRSAKDIWEGFLEESLDTRRCREQGLSISPVPLLVDGVRDALAYVNDVKTSFAWVLFFPPFSPVGTWLPRGRAPGSPSVGQLGQGSRSGWLQMSEGPGDHLVHRLSRRARILDVSACEHSVSLDTGHHPLTADRPAPRAPCGP